jgi:transposase
MMKMTQNGTGGWDQRAFRQPASAAYKLHILREVDSCSTPSEVGALLRREGLYVSHLTQWRNQRDAGGLKPSHQGGAEIDDLRRRLERTEAELETARKVIATQGQLSALMEHLLELNGSLGDMARSGLPSG